MSGIGGVKHFDWASLAPADLEIAKRYVPDLRAPDLVIANEDSERDYLYRWHQVPRNNEANVYFHIQTGDDPERPLHDHPWDNQSVILAGGYREHMASRLSPGFILTHVRKKGDVVHRSAYGAHRLELLPGHAYAMTQFSTGPKVKVWGFYFGHEFVPYTECCIFEGNKTHFVYPDRLKHFDHRRTA